MLALDAVLVLLLLLRAAAISAHPGLEGLEVHHSGGAAPIPVFTDVLRLRESGGEFREPRLLYSWTVGIVDPRRLTDRRLLLLRAGFGPHATK